MRFPFAANSAICYVLAITAVNPQSFNLLFERFLSLERGDPPDIDIDFEHERREEVIQYIYRRYGRHRVAMVANVITFRRRSALRTVSTALELPAEHPRVQGLARELLSFPRHLGIHSAGFFLTDRPLNWLVPTEPATMPARSVIQWCKEDIEALNFFKIDILGLGMLTAIRKAFQLIAKHHNKPLSLYSIPTDDPKTYDMLCQADTVGTFQVESRAQMAMLPQLKPKKFYDLVIEIALIRPGPIQGQAVHPYLRRRQGLEKVHYPHPQVKAILERTLGIVLFQEQAMRIAMLLGDFTPGQADALRRNMGAWGLGLASKQLDDLLDALVQGMKKKGLSPDFIENLVNQLRVFANYGFPESHAISFALISYASCYLKAHFPSAFFAAVLNAQPMGFYSPHALLAAATRENIPLLPICINKSSWDHTLETTKVGLGIRLGLRLIKGLCEEATHSLLDHRQSQPNNRFHSLDQLSELPLTRRDILVLASANALESLQLTRSQALWQAAAFPLASQLWSESHHLKDAEAQLHSQLGHLEHAMLRLKRDHKATGVSLGCHPTKLIWENWPYPVSKHLICPSHKLLEHTQKSVHVFGLLLIRQAPPSANGMVFITLEDEYGFINLALPPTFSERHEDHVESSSFLCIRGKLTRVGSHSILVDKIFTISDHQLQAPPTLRSSSRWHRSKDVKLDLDASSQKPEALIDP